jgi:hemerythrin-like domain-containing protein
MDAFALLTEDHQKVQRMMDKLAGTTEGAHKTRDSLFTELKKELEIHAAIEEEVFYPALRDAKETADLVDEALEEHETVKQLLHDLEDTANDTEEWTSMFAELKENVEHHVEEEEGDLFKKARKVLSADTIEELGRRLQDHKEALQKAS